MSTPSAVVPAAAVRQPVTPPAVLGRFQDLGIIDPILRAVRELGYEHPTPIQERAIPLALAGRDILGCAQTGTGKTAAFAIPTLQRLFAKPSNQHGRRPIRALILSPTRELAAQIAESFVDYGKGLGLRSTVIFGGVGYGGQAQALRAGVDILVATPGRLLDWLQRGEVNLRQVETFVLDEADRMLDMGFLPAIRTVLATLPKQRQTLFFSATMPRDILQLANSILSSPERIEVAPVATTADRVEQRVYFVERTDKRGLLLKLLGDGAVTRALVFTNTKRGANRVVEQLERASVRAEAIHGNKSQGARERALSHFKTGVARVLVATDIAARGIDVEGVSHVINFDLPVAPENYVHRIGRTARAGAAGVALSFCSSDERSNLASIERTIRLRLPVATQPGGPIPGPESVPVAAAPSRGGPPSGGRPGQQRRSRSFRPRSSPRPR